MARSCEEEWKGKGSLMPGGRIGVFPLTAPAAAKCETARKTRRETSGQTKPLTHRQGNQTRLKRHFPWKKRWPGPVPVPSVPLRENASRALLSMTSGWVNTCCGESCRVYSLAPSKEIAANAITTTKLLELRRLPQPCVGLASAPRLTHLLQARPPAECTASRTRGSASRTAAPLRPLSLPRGPWPAQFPPSPKAGRR